MVPSRALFRIISLFGNRDRPYHVREDPFRVLIGCILSQRTKDEVTDSAYKRLFSRYTSIRELADADPEEVSLLIYPVGFYRRKARTIIRAARYVLENFSGRVPENMEDLLAIPGVGRKCANIVLAYGFGRPAIPVDTHVFRISKRLGIASEGDTEEDVEKKLKDMIPENLWCNVNHALVRFGREICRPVGPRCDVCPVRQWCAFGQNGDR